MDRIVVARIYLTSGSVIEIKEDPTEYNPVDTHKFFVEASEKLKNMSDASYMKYGNYTILFKYIEAIEIVDDRHYNDRLVTCCYK